MMKLNKKGQEIGNLLPLFPLLILIFLLMGIFIVLAMGMSLGKPKTVPQFFSEIPSGDLMFKKISVDIDKDMTTPGTKETQVLDAIREYAITIKDPDFNRGDRDKNRLFTQDYLSDLGKLLNENKNMLYVNIDQLVDSTFLWIYKDGVADIDKELSRYVYRDYISTGYTRSISFQIPGKAEKVRVTYYYGPCRKDENGGCLQG
ncbi:MAG: hypothetical protein QXD13_02130 [Candidatus Pacearchaeota archaeon]